MMKVVSRALILSTFGIALLAAPRQAVAQSNALTFPGHVALWTVAIKADKTADYEKLLAKLRDALVSSKDPQRQEQARGWRVMKMGMPLPDGHVAYVHIIDPVVAGADYTLLKPIYDEFPKEASEYYELYRGAFGQNLAALSGDIVLDMSKDHPPMSASAAGQ